MRNRILLLGLALAPSIAAAQLTITESNDTDRIVSQGECNNNPADGLSFSWTFPNFVAGGQYTLTASDTLNCPQSSQTQVVNNSTVGTVDATGPTGIFPASGTVSVNSIVANLAGYSCSGSKTTIFFCVTLSTATTVTPVTGTVTLDLQSPPAPVLQSVSPDDSSLHVSAAQGAGSADGGASGSVDTFTITAVNHDAPSETHTTDKISTTGSTLTGRIDGLTNGVLYDVTVTAFSRGGNASLPSNPLQGTPVPVNDFFRSYRNAGGQETGGCAAGAAGMLALLAVPLALRAWRRRS
jgi:hypothetical protein